MTKKYTEVRAGSQIVLKQDTTLKGMNGDPRHLKAGKYFVNGFWADICGLSKRSNTPNEVGIQARELVAFEGITL